MKKAWKRIAAAAAAYLLVCLCLTLTDYLQYKKTRIATDLDAEYVLNVYTDEEIAADPALKDVKLYCFPSPSGEATPYVVYLPGGSYTSCNPYDVCIPAAAEANELGYTAFVLTYRVGDYVSDYMPLDDVAAGISYITEHAWELGAESGDYMLTGFSAGGHLAGLFATEALGYGKYGVQRPAALGLGYPAVNVTDGRFLTGNIITDSITYSIRQNCIRIMLGEGAEQAAIDVLDLYNSVDANYPRTYIAQGDADFLVPHRFNSDKLAQALERNETEYVYCLFPGLTHGFGIGTGSKAEGWNRDAIAFWHAP